MQDNKKNTIYTIGHSTHSIDEFISMLQAFKIKLLVDVRHYPGSRKFPHFNKENLSEALKNYNIKYIHLLGLGGRRNVLKNSKNTLWHKDAFRGYADYMETKDFEIAANELQQLAVQQTIAFMCSEAVWWRCHRSMIADYLKAKGWKVLHIMNKQKAEEHPYTSPARIIGNKVFYYENDLFKQ